MKKISNYNETLFEFDTTIPAKKKFYLKEIILDEEYRRWFSTKGNGKIFVLNKGRCGNGGTTGFIDYAKRNYKGLSIIVPNVSIVKSKEWDNDLCCLYGGAEGVDRNKPIRVGTWDQLGALNCFPQFGMDKENNFWVGSLLVVDEYHKLIDDCNFRDICAKVVNAIINTKSNVVLMSATPNYEFVDFLKETSGKEVISYNISYDKEDYPTMRLVWMEKGNKKLFNIVNEVMKSERRRVQNVNIQAGKDILESVGQTVFFYNSVKRVSEIVSQLEDTSDVEVLCSKSNENKGIPCYSPVFNNEKKFHFMTSAYFTGMDVKVHIDKVVIIGGNDQMTLSYSSKEIKQMLGRMRSGYENAFIIHDGGHMNKKEYAHFTAEKERCEYIVENIQVNARNDVKFIQEYLNYLYYTGVVEKMEGWQDLILFKNMMSIYDEYEVVAQKMKEPDRFEKKKDISFSEFKRRRMNGEDVAYRYKAMCEKFIEMCGLERFSKASRNEIERYLKLNEMVGDVSIESLNGAEKYELLLGDGFYFGRLLMGVLDYLGFKCEYDELEKKMNDVFGCFCIYESGNTAKKNGCLFLNVMDKGIRKKSDIGECDYIKELSLSSPILDKHHLTTIKVSKKVSKPNQRTQCITDNLDTMSLNSLMDDNYKQQFFSKILQDPSLIKGIKEDPQWKKVFDNYKSEQTMISEFYKDVPSNVRYPHKKDEMEKIDCLIVDIDDSISYDEFQSIYSTYEYTAYPTLSNTDPDNWRKFRVIFPLANTLSIPNDNLGVLKILRRMVCKYEDKNHQLGAYINKEQWAIRREHPGRVVEIGQDMVVYLDALVKSLKTYSCKFKKSKDGTFVINDNRHFWSLEQGKRYYQDHDKDNERHSALFLIKNRLTDDDCELFVDWLRVNHPSKVHHWLSHKRIVRMND